jgi:hypothetical protein
LLVLGLNRRIFEIQVTRSTSSDIDCAINLVEIAAFYYFGLTSEKKQGYPKKNRRTKILTMTIDASAT